MTVVSINFIPKIKNTEAVVRRYSVKKVFLEISQNSQENTCARGSFLIKLQAEYQAEFATLLIPLFTLSFFA